jgi:hypothetical protein
MGDINADGTIILKLILQKDMWVCVEFVWCTIGTMS